MLTGGDNSSNGRVFNILFGDAVMTGSAQSGNDILGADTTSGDGLVYGDLACGCVANESEPPRATENHPSLHRKTIWRPSTSIL